MQLRDIHADMDHQITRTDQLRLVDCCYDSHAMTNLSAMAKLNVVTGYTLSSQIGSRGSDSRGIMISHGFVKAMWLLGEGKDVDHFVSVVSRTKHLLLIKIPDGLLGSPRNEHSPPFFLFRRTLSELFES
jgi:hypothetical protein